MSPQPAAAPRSNAALIIVVVVLVIGLAVAALVLFNMRQNQSGFWAQTDPAADATTATDAQVPPPLTPAPIADGVAIDSATGQAYEPENYDETIDADPAADAAAMAADAAAMATDAAATATDAAAEAEDVADTAESSASDAEDLSRDVAAYEQERQRLAEQRAAERRAAQARADARADAAAAERRIAEEAAAIEAQAQREAQAMEAQQQNTPDRIYDQRRGACPGGFLGSACRKKLRYELCDGRWSDSPPAGQSVCEAKNR